MFYGRETELSKLEKLYASDKFQCAVIYGRRRVGKTTLIGKFCEGKSALLFSALESTAEENLKEFSQAINSFLYPGSSVHADYRSFSDAFDKIAEEAAKSRFIFVIDEYPYLAKADKSISSRLQHLIDHKLLKTNIFFIICGSSMSFMENQVLGYQSPIYGRRTAQFRLEPLSYRLAACAYPALTPEKQVLLFGIAGGIPHYLNNLDIGADGDIESAIISRLLEQSSYLFEEPSNLLKQELREPATYNAIITAIASGANKLNEIASRTHLESGLCSKYIGALISLGLIGRKTPVMETVKNKSIYYLKDNLFNFWYRFVPGNMSMIAANKSASVFEAEVKPRLSEYLGRIFEDICIQYLTLFADNLPFTPKEIGSWWGGNPETKKQEEIDILAIAGKKAIFGECKWQNELLDLAVLKNLKRKAEIFRDFEEKYYYLFSKSGFSSGVIEAAEKDDSINLISLSDIYL
ncbi:MAG: ATP-binding protein [Firmicutes bacterium]|nr:ATP-binding protein [Bacillota bacterium]